MYALIAFKGTVIIPARADVPQRTQHLIGIEKRTMGCFNGMNTEGAFSPSPGAFEAIYFVNAQGELSPGNSIHGRACDGATRAWDDVKRTLGINDQGIAWGECLGLGFITSWTGGQTGKSYSDSYSGVQGSGRLDPYITSALSREGFRQTFRDGATGDTVHTMRVLTPNELILNNLYESVQRRCGGHQPETESIIKDQRSSTVTLAIVYDAIYCGSFLQFVGSERPSGLAVAYLQAWRNCAEINTSSGWQNGNAPTLQAIKAATQANPARASGSMHRPAQRHLIGIISYFCHHGSDSDIITFAGDYFIKLVSRYGIFELASMFRDTRPMATEGRYNKGGQSDAINRNVQTALTRLRWAAPRESVLNQFNELKAFSQRFASAAIYLTAAHIQNIGASRSDRGSVQEMINTRIETFKSAAIDLAMMNPQNLMTAFFTEINSMPDPRAPTAPATPAIDGASVTFHQWAAQVEQTIH